MKWNVLIFVLIFSLCCRVVIAAGDSAPGIKIGAKAPAVTFIDQYGKRVALKDLTKKGMVALVFYRSAKW